MADEQILDNITLPTAKQGTDVGFALTDLPKPIFGHVTFAEKGNDIVCAAVSSAVREPSNMPRSCSWCSTWSRPRRLLPVATASK